MNNGLSHSFLDPSVDGKSLLSHSLSVVDVGGKNLENCGCRDSIKHGVYEKSCELKQNSALSGSSRVNKRLNRSNKKSGDKSIPAYNADKQLRIADECRRKYTKTIHGQFFSKSHCFHQRKQKDEVASNPGRKTDTSSESRILSMRGVRKFSSPLNNSINKHPSVRSSTSKDFRMVQHVSPSLPRLTQSTGPDSSSRGHVPNHLLKAVEGAIRLSRDHHAVRRQHNAANSIHRDRYSKHLHRNYQTHTEISRLESGDCSSEPEKRTREASCTLFTRRLRCKGDSTNMIVESTSREPNDSGHKPDKESDQLTSNENSTPNALIPDSSNTVGDIHLLRDYSAQEIVHDSNEHVTNSINPSDQSSNQFLSKNASFSSVENKIGELVIPEVLGLTPPISHDQDCVEDKTASPLTRKTPMHPEDSFAHTSSNNSRSLCTSCHSHSRSDHSLTESDHSETCGGGIENQEEGEVADDVDDDDDTEVFNSSPYAAHTRKRCWSRPSPTSCKTPKISSDLHVIESTNVSISENSKNISPYPNIEQRRWSRCSQHYEKDGSRNSSSGFMDLTLRASPGYEDQHPSNPNTSRFSHSPESHRNHGSQYPSSISRSPSLRNSRNEQYRHHPNRSSNSASKYHPCQRHYKSPERSARDFTSGKHNKSSVSSNQPKRRTHHSPVPLNNPNSCFRRFERERINLHNRRFRALSPVINRNAYRRIGINSLKVSGPRFNRTHHQRRF
ncbi:hypothetical protein MS3_00003172 [Schistosoma haematobium]|nr:hypothetical protein MS3_00003172 [Schistosoma haematobium]KAH9590527.1 hypothetical protein MS3_00003172 [Schistosoma haematobium]